MFYPTTVPPSPPLSPAELASDITAPTETEFLTETISSLDTGMEFDTMRFVDGFSPGLLAESWHHNTKVYCGVSAFMFDSPSNTDTSAVPGIFDKPEEWLSSASSKSPSKSPTQPNCGLSAATPESSQAGSPISDSKMRVSAFQGHRHHWAQDQHWEGERVTNGSGGGSLSPSVEQIYASSTVPYTTQPLASANDIQNARSHPSVYPHESISRRASVVVRQVNQPFISEYHQMTGQRYLPQPKYEVPQISVQDEHLTHTRGNEYEGNYTLGPSRSQGRHENASLPSGPLSTGRSSAGSISTHAFPDIHHSGHRMYRPQFSPVTSPPFSGPAYSSYPSHHVPSSSWDNSPTYYTNHHHSPHLVERGQHHAYQYPSITHQIPVVSPVEQESRPGPGPASYIPRIEPPEQQQLRTKKRRYGSSEPQESRHIAQRIRSSPSSNDDNLGMDDFDSNQLGAYDTQPDAQGPDGFYILVPLKRGSDVSAQMDSQGNVVPNDKKRVIIRRKTMTEDDKKRVKHKRDVGVCLRCKLMKEKCEGDPDNYPCQRCKDVKTGIWSCICVSAILYTSVSIGPSFLVFDKKLYRQRAAKLTAVLSPQWLQNSRRTTIVHNGYGPSLELHVDEFSIADQVRDALNHVFWREVRDATFQFLPSSGYGLKEPSSWANEDSRIDAYIDAHVEPMLEELSQNNSKPAITVTLQCAHRAVKSNPQYYEKIQKCLRLWAAQMMFFHNAWRIKEGDTLNMDTINDKRSKYHGIRPLPRLLHQQLDSIIEERIDRLEKEILTDLQTRAISTQSKPKDGSPPHDYYIMFMEIFIYLSALERDTWGLLAWRRELDRQAKQQSSRDPSKPCRPIEWPLGDDANSDVNKLIMKNQRAAHNLSKYLRGVFKGGIPFGDKSSKHEKFMLESGEHAKEYMREMDKVLRSTSQQKKIKEHLDKLEESYDKNKGDCLEQSLSGHVFVAMA